MTLRRSLPEPLSGSEEPALSCHCPRALLARILGVVRPNWSVREDQRARAYRQRDRRRLVLNPPLERAYAPTQPRHFPCHILRFLVETVLRTRHSRARQ